MYDVVYTLPLCGVVLCRVVHHVSLYFGMRCYVLVCCCVVLRSFVRVCMLVCVVVCLCILVSCIVVCCVLLCDVLGCCVMLSVWRIDVCAVVR